MGEISEVQNVKNDMHMDDNSSAEATKKTASETDMWKRFLIAAPLCGYALYLALVNVLFHPETLVGPMTGDPLALNSISIALLLGRFAACIVCIPLSLRLCKVIRFTPVVAMSTALLGFLVLGIAASLSDSSNASMLTLWMLFAGVLIGIADSLACLLWLTFSVSMGIKRLYLFVFGSYLASLPVYLLLVVVPQIARIALSAILFALIIIFAVICLRRTPRLALEFSMPVLKSSLMSLWRPFFSMFLLAFLGGFMLHTEASRGIAVETFQYTSIATQAVVLCILLIPPLVTKREVKIAAIYKAMLFLSAFGFLLLPAIWNYAALANACAQLGAMVTAALFLCLVAQTVRDTHLPPFFMFSLALLGSQLGRAVGAGVALIWGTGLAPRSFSSMFIAVAVVYVIAMASSFLFKDNRFADKINDETSIPVTELPDVDRLDSRCEKAAECYQLTPRERDILPLLCKGHTIKAISERLIVSENTIKSHIKNIYLKLDIHSRQELIEIVEAVEL